MCEKVASSGSMKDNTTWIATRYTLHKTKIDLEAMVTFLTCLVDRLPQQVYKTREFFRLYSCAISEIAEGKRLRDKNTSKIMKDFFVNKNQKYLNSETSKIQYFWETRQFFVVWYHIILLVWNFFVHGHVPWMVVRLWFIQRKCKPRINDCEVCQKTAAFANFCFVIILFFVSGKNPCTTASSIFANLSLLC